MRTDQMHRLFAMLREAGITEDERHDWATSKLIRPVITFRSLTEHELSYLISALENELIPYDLCDELGPHDEPCVVDVGHPARDEDHAAEDGACWMVRA